MEFWILVAFILTLASDFIVDFRNKGSQSPFMKDRYIIMKSGNVISLMSLLITICQWEPTHVIKLPPIQMSMNGTQ